MNAQEMRASTGLAALYALRMMGMFLILPVFALYARELPGGDNPALIGLALGCYGLTQAILQLPFGMMSDHIGRKRLIYIGLILFALGSLIAAYAPTLNWLIFGRIVQGSGAIAAVITALLADLTREENRTRAMAMIGMSIGLTFAFSLVLGPLLNRWIGVSGIFILTAILCGISILGVKFWIPDPPIQRFHADAATTRELLPDVLKNTELLRLNFGIFALHATQMALFLVVPLALIQTAGLDKHQHWQVYLPVVIVGFIVMIPAIIYSEKKAKLKQVFASAIALMMITQIGLSQGLHSFHAIVFLLGLYFIGFNILEATLPSLVSKIAPARAKGTAMGIYNTAQSIGLFVGGGLGGWVYARLGAQGTFLFCAAFMLVWLILALSMKKPPAVRSALFPLADSWFAQRWGYNAEMLQNSLQNLHGVEEVVVSVADGQVYMKVLQSGWDDATAHELLGLTPPHTP